MMKTLDKSMVNICVKKDQRIRKKLNYTFYSFNFELKNELRILFWQNVKLKKRKKKLINHQKQ